MQETHVRVVRSTSTSSSTERTPVVVRTTSTSSSTERMPVVVRTTSTSASTERTPLTGADRNSPSYVFTTNTSRTYRNKIKRFQCCICAGLLAIIVVAVVVTVAVSVNHDTEDKNTTSAGPTTPTTSTTPNTSAMTLMNLSSSSLIDQQMDILQSLTWPLTPDGSEAEWPEPQPAALQISSALDAGQAALKAKDLQEETTPSLDANSPSSRHQAAMGTGETAFRYSRAGYIADRATKELFKGLDKDSVPRGRSANLQADWLPPEVCGEVPKFVDMCTKTPFRSVDGTCNNPNHPRKWGVAFRPYRRLLPPDYADGVSSPRRASDGGPLPSARDVSVHVHRPVYQDDPKFTVMLAVWGQFMDHDITATALNKGINMSAISCCYAAETPELMHPECFPVMLSDTDSYYHKYNLTCMEFVRASPAPVCSLGPREQQNQATAFLDGSAVYGSEDALTAQLRTMQGGQLKSTTSPDGRELLPYDKTPGDGCNQEEKAKKHQYCFMSGDKRANENLHLTTMHLLLVRQHNALAKRLSQLNPNWDDERLFQEARRIVSAQMQHITYKEFLPVLLGGEMMAKMNITLQDTGYHDVYNASVDPSVANGFAGSAFRFAHTLLPSLFRMLGRDTNTSDYVELHRMLFNPFQLYSPNKMDDSLRGAFATNCQKIDTYFTNQVTEKLFEGEPVNVTANPKAPKVPGLDLVSLNIQRGRDDGLPAYPEWRRLCGLPVPKNFSDMEAYIDPDTVQRLASLYRSVDDVDMYSGALSEVPVSGGALGPTVLCVLSDQFYRTKIGDRFWYETSHQPQAFTPEQLQEIRKTTLAGIICENSDNIREAQPWVMRLKKTGNYPVPCDGDVIQHPDLTWWREKGGHFPRNGRDMGNVGTSMGVVTHSGPSIASKDVALPDPGIQELAVGTEEIGLWGDANGLVPVHTGQNLSERHSARVKIRVISGVVVAVGKNSASAKWWDGTLPLNITRKVFDSDADVQIDDVATMPVFGQGVLWRASLRKDSNSVHIVGNFSLPRYLHGKAVNVQWWTGAFRFNVTFDGADIDDFVGDALFSSRLYFHSKPGQPEAPSQKPVASEGVGEVTYDPPNQNEVWAAKRLPIVLSGSYQPGEAFLWNGEAMLVVP